MAGRATEKHWAVYSEEEFRKRVEAIKASYVANAEDQIQRLIEDYAIGKGVEGVAKPKTKDEKKARTRGGVMVLREPIDLLGGNDDRDESEAHAIVYEVPDLASGGQPNHASYQKLRLMLGFHMIDLHHILQFGGIDAEDSKGEIEQLVPVDDKVSYLKPISFDGARQKTSKHFREIVQFNIPHSAYWKRCNVEIAQKSQTDGWLEKCSQEKKKIVRTLNRAMWRAKILQLGLHELSSANVHDGSLADQERFEELVFEKDRAPPTAEECFLIAVYGQIDLIPLWPNYFPVKDMFDLASFVGARQLGKNSPATDRLGDTYVREIEGHGESKARRADELKFRKVFAKTMLDHLSQYQTDSFIAELRTAAESMPPHAA